MEAYVIMGMVGPWQIVLLILVVVLLFGGRKIPELMKGIGQGMKEFKNATKDTDGKNDKKADKEIEKGDA
jgi:sec-independent protein translocase protein TatA